MENGQHHEASEEQTVNETNNKNEEEEEEEEKENGDEHNLSNTNELIDNEKQHDLGTQSEIIKSEDSKTKSTENVNHHPTGVRKKEKKRDKNKNVCVICNTSFQDKSELDHHVVLENHHKSKLGDDGRHWKFRSPPWIGANQEYKMCPTLMSEGQCRLDLQCSDAHSEAELGEWRDRLKLRQIKANKAAQHTKSFSDGLIEKLAAGGKVNVILTNALANVECSCNSNLNVIMSEKGSSFQWLFTIKSSKQLKNVCLLSESGVQQQFKIDSVNEKEFDFENELLTKETYSTKSYIDWIHPAPDLGRNQTKFADQKNNNHTFQYEISIIFEASIYGTFRQTVIFAFGFEPYLRRDLSVDVKAVEKEPIDEESAEKLQELHDLIVHQSERWDGTNCNIVDFDPPLHVPPDEDKILLNKYQMPQPLTFKPSRSVIEPMLTKNNYKSRMHELLYIEEMAQFEQISQFNVKTRLSIISKYLLMPTSTNSSTAKYARPGELFGKLTLSGSLSEDTTAGRLILTNCTSLLIMEAGAGQSAADHKDLRKAYIAGIEDTGKATLYLRLSAALVKDCGIKEDEEFKAEIQFQMNRLPLCEMHHAIDQLPDMGLVYPTINENLQIPWTPGKQWAEDMSSKLNAKQREAIIAITCPLVVPMPPVLMIGPYGTGKTFTLAQAIKILLKQPDNRILVCTHSNSAADLYIRDYLDNFISQNPHIKLLRVYYKNRWVQTVHTTVQKYCLIDDRRTFRNPTKDDVIKCDIVIATLATSRFLSTIGLPMGHFTHILLDEAAQAMECETIMPLALAKPNITRIVMAGDHMQLSPEIFSSFALDRKFNKSLLERLYDLYPVDFRCKILLCENYRSHEVIINYTSELFYEQKLYASGKQSQHELWHPLTFFTSRGEDVQDSNSTSFYNNAEVYEVVDRVAELQKTWPKAWGYRDENSIGIVTPYYDQVQRIRSELRKRRLFGVSVERVLNVQGKQFRAIFLSTVRTRKTCVPNQEDQTADFGFLSNDKLLNTAITRAQSLVAVVGDPVALCSIGKCRKLWERFIDSARKQKSLFGTTWTALRVMLNSCELKKTYVLNPLAPEFVPRARRKKEAYLQKMFSNVLQSEVMRQPNAAYAALMQPYLAAQWGATYRTIPPLMGLYPGPPPPTAIPYASVVPPFPALSPEQGLFPGQQILPHQRLHMPPTRHERGQFYPPTNRPPNHPRAESPHRVLRKNMAPPSPLSTSSLPPQFQTQLPPGFPTNEAFPMLPPPLSPNIANVPPPNANFGGTAARQTHSPMVKTSLANQNSPQHDSSKNFTFLKDGIHFPHIPSTPPPIIRKDSYQDQRTGAYNKNTSIHQNLNNKSLIEIAVEVLPHDMELKPFLASPQMQMAWFTQLSISKGEEEAKLFKELIVAMQQSSELLSSIESQLRLKKMSKVSSQPLSSASSSASAASSKPQSQPSPSKSWLDEPQRPPPFNSSSVLMPSATSADAFYTLANAAVRQQHLQQHVEEEDESNEFGDLNQDPIIQEVLSKNGGSSPSGDSWGSMSSMLNIKSQESIPLYKRRAGAAPSDASVSPISFPDNSEHVSRGHFDMSALDVIDEGLGKRSNTMPSSSLSSIWSQNPPNNSSQGNRTYANVLRQHDDPLMKIRQLGTRGSQELSEGSSETTSDGTQQPFSPFGARW